MLYPEFSKALKQKNLGINLVRKALSPAIRYLFFSYYVVTIQKLISAEKPDRLMVVNGGYPAGDTCRAASIAWGLLKGNRNAIHNFHNMATPSSWWNTALENEIDRLVLNYSAAIISVSRVCAESIQIRPAIKDNPKVTYIYNGIESPTSTANSLSLRHELKLSENELICLMLGTYEPRKGHDFLLQAFQQVIQQVPSARLVICGDGFPAEISRVKSLVTQYCLNQSVFLMGFRKEIHPLLKDADILTVPSQSFESFGLTSVEAMSCKVPVVATNIGGIPEVVANDDGGYCVQHNDVNGFAQAMIRLLKDPDLRREQGQKGFERYQKLFTAERMASEYAALIRNGV
ncbi:MAG: glycosyltransferase family 4 protein [SAR324 cluster bacterium]|nr:glycosyltransferase family 4 protein [SAR324 cluster bacterium]